MQGRCLCGKVRVKADPEGRNWIAFCHCESCRRATGAPVTAYVALRDTAWVWASGRPRIYASSEKARRGFCAECGTPLTYTHADRPGETHFHVSIFDTANDLVPERHYFPEERLSWLAVDGDPSATD